MTKQRNEHSEIYQLAWVGSMIDVLGISSVCHATTQEWVVLNRDKIGANRVNRRALEFFNVEKSFGAHRTSTRRTLETLDGTFESIVAGILVGGNWLTASLTSERGVASEDGVGVI